MAICWRKRRYSAEPLWTLERATHVFGATWPGLVLVRAGPGRRTCRSSASTRCGVGAYLQSPDTLERARRTLARPHDGYGGRLRIVARTMARRRLRTGRSHRTTECPSKGRCTFLCVLRRPDRADAACLAPIRVSGTSSAEAGAGSAGEGEGRGDMTVLCAGTVPESPGRLFCGRLLRVRRRRATPSSSGSRTTAASTAHCSSDMISPCLQSLRPVRCPRADASHRTAGVPPYRRTPAGSPLSGAAMASRIEESAWMFFIR